MSDTGDDAAWPPQLKIGREVGGVAAAPIGTQVTAGDIHV